MIIANKAKIRYPRKKSHLYGMWWYYGWVCRCCRPLVKTIWGRIMIGFIVVVICQ